MLEPLLVRDVMRIGVPTCKLEDTVAHVAALMIDGGHSAVIVLDEEADTRGLGGRGHPPLRPTCLQRLPPRTRSLIAIQDVMDEDVPECASDLPLETRRWGSWPTWAWIIFFFLHRAAGRMWPASVLSLRDVVKALAGPEYLKNQGMHAALCSDADGSIPPAIWVGGPTLRNSCARPDRSHSSVRSDAL